MTIHSKLETIQVNQNLNDVHPVGEIGPGGAYHEYVIVPHGKDPVEELHYGGEVGKVKFQRGPRNVEGSTKGVIDSDLLEIVRNRLACFQSGEFACEYNDQALFYVEEALKWLNKRVEDRIARNALGTYNK